MLKQTQLREPMNYLGISCLETVDGKDLEARVDALEANTSNIQNPTRTPLTTIVGEVQAGCLLSPNLLGGTICFAGRPPGRDGPQYFNIDSGINDYFLHTHYEGDLTSNPVYNYCVAVAYAKITTLSWTRISYWPGYPAEARPYIQLEVDKQLVGSAVLLREAIDFLELDPPIEIKPGQVIALRYTNCDTDYWRSMGKIRLWANVVPTRHNTI